MYRGVEKGSLDITCIILAGGEALRLGQDKLKEIVGRKSLLDGVLSHARAVCNDTIIVTSQERTIPTNGSVGVKVVRDLLPGRGPLAGVYSGLAASDRFYNLVLAADMPFLNDALLTYMIQSAMSYDLVVPDVDGLVEPLHAVYSKNCLAPIRYLLKENELSLHQLIPLVKVRHISTVEIDRFDPQHLSLFNINTRADLEKARQLAKGISGL